MENVFLSNIQTSKKTKNPMTVYSGILLSEDLNQGSELQQFKPELNGREQFGVYIIHAVKI